MKKFFCCSILTLSLFLFTGCETKQLSCTKDTEYNNGMKMTQNVNISYKNDKTYKLHADMNVNLGEIDIDIENQISQIESQFVNFKDSNGFDYSFSKKDDGFSFKLDVNLKKFNKDNSQEFDLYNTKKTLEDAKLEFENDGYTCK